MASLLRAYGETKLGGKVYTPRFIVTKILDDVGYRAPKILGKSILDPACGDGNFLVEVARRIIKHSPDPARDLLHLHGWDIDEEAITNCRQRLDALIHPLRVDWNIRCQDSLLQAPLSTYAPRAENVLALETPMSSESPSPKKTKGQLFDFIVGNPPYIRIQHLGAKERKYIQKRYALCGHGSTDIFIAFFELAARLLQPDGQAGLITPNSYFTTVAGHKLREMLADIVCQITNYNHIQLFEGASTYCAITVFGKRQHKQFRFQRALSAQALRTTFLPNSDLRAKRFWTFDYRSKGKRRLKDICRIYTGLATLGDKVYVVKKLEDLDDQYMKVATRLAGEQILEKAILRPIIKGSRYRRHEAPVEEYIIFPYAIELGRASLIAEEQIKRNFPRTYAYLLQTKDYLVKRDNGKIRIWYEYGRTQSLVTGFGKKIIFSPMSDKPCFCVCSDEQATFYSGYAIKYTGDLYALAAKLNSAAMEDYIRTIGRDFRNGWKAYSKGIVQEFMV